MKRMLKFWIKRRQFLAIVAAALCSASTAHAAPSGALDIAQVVSGVVNLSASRFDFSPPTSGGAAGSGDVSIGGLTTITYSGGVVTAATNPYGVVRDIDAGSGTVTDFIRLYTGGSLPTPPGNGTLQTYPAFDLTAVAPGGSAQGALNDCAGVTAVGVSCSPLITPAGGSAFVSPLVMTNRGTFTEITLGVTLLARDATGSASWTGGFTMQVAAQGVTSATPASLQTVLNGGGMIAAPYSATFAVVALPPIANAGPDQTVLQGSLVQLNGSGSTDPNMQPLTYAWTLITRPPGSNAVLSNPTSVNPTFTPDVFGTYVAQLVVNNGSMDSSPDTVTITALLVITSAPNIPALGVGALAGLVLLLAAAAFARLRKRTA